jgi:hypothetical protein
MGALLGRTNYHWWRPALANGVSRFMFLAHRDEDLTEG